jgi:branched-chain amino acid transport system permease protein
VSTVVLLLLTGLGLAALYFLVAAGLSLIFGLADVLNFAHGIFLAAGAYGTWWAAAHLPGGFAVAVAFGVLVGAVLGVLVELVLIRPLYARPIQQVLVTVGLSLAGVALLRAWWGADPLVFPRPQWTRETTRVLGATVPNDRFLLIVAALLVLGALLLLLKRTRLGLVIRAGVEDRSMVTALGIDVRIAFTAVFAIGGARRCARGRVLRQRLAGAGHVAAHLRVHRRGDRRDGLDHRFGPGRRAGGAGAAVRQLLHGVRGR